MYVINRDSLAVSPRSDGRHTIPKFTLGSFLGAGDPDPLGAGDHFGDI